MRLFALVAAASAALVAAKQSVHQKLVDLAAANNGVINLDSATYELLTSPERTWSASVEFTALQKKRGCHPCHNFEPAWKEVAAIWSKVPAQHRNEHFFATLDFDNGSQTFAKLGIATAPVVMVYPPREGPRKAPSSAPMKYDFSEGYDAGPLAEQLSRFTPIRIPYKRPFNWKKWGTNAVGLLGGAVVLKFVAPIVLNRWAWAAVTIPTSLIMTSGYMFTRIRHSPYTGRDGNWVASGYSSQFGQEVHVLAAVYGLLGFSFFVLTVIVPRQQSPAKQRVQVYIWTGVIVVLYSVLVSLFKLKNRGYPFKLFI